MTKRQKQSLLKIIVTSLLLVLIAILKPYADSAVIIVLSLLTYLLIAYEILIDAVVGLFNGRLLDENFLMATASIGAIVLAFYSKSGDFFEAIAVILFYQVGELFESYAIGKSRKNISELMDIRPDYANVEIDGELKRVDPDEVNVGDIIIVNPGEKIPIDGTVIEGSSTLDTAALTGESVSKEAFVGESVISGCINLTGVLKIRTTKEFGESTVSKILELVEESSSHKSKSEDFISKFARVYTPAVCIGAVLLAIIPPIINMIIGNEANFSEWIYQALTFLVISCPCALVISIPLSFFCGNRRSEQRGNFDQRLELS